MNLAPVKLRKCLRCGHYECPCCTNAGRPWCDDIACIDPDDHTPDELLCPDECVYAEPLSAEMTAWFASLAMYDEHGIGIGGFRSYSDGRCAWLTSQEKREELG
jgi:hypothetical protein